MPHPPPSLDLAARFAVALCTVLGLLSVAVNFLAARGREAVQSERRSPVATGTMLAFFAGLYAVLRLRLTEVRVHRGVVLAGLVLLVAGTVLNLLGRVALGGNWGDHIVLYRDHDLVVRGAYRWVRHPLYAALLWMASGAALVFGNPLALGLVLGVFLPAMIFRARQEEAALTRRFPGYARYRARTGMFLPMPWRRN